MITWQSSVADPHTYQCEFPWRPHQPGKVSDNFIEAETMTDWTEMGRDGAIARENGSESSNQQKISA